jgi:anhydro-N-acetylmuramic acid kinase
MERRLTAIGLMSGTSLDGVDAALIETDGETIFATGPSLTIPYPDALRAELAAVARDPARAEHDPLDDLTRAVTDANYAALSALLAEHRGRSPVSVVGFHGQTVLHRPERGFTRQLGDGALLSRLSGLDVVDGFRLADLAGGGQGAPLVPLYHAALAQSSERPLEPPLAVLNLGGVGNVTFLGHDQVIAFDTGPGNALIDDWMGRHTGARCDSGGAAAASGRIDDARLAALLDHDFFAAPPPKSLDRNQFSDAPVAGLSLADGAATLTAFTAHSVAKALPHLPAPPRRLLVTGGGRHNPVLMAMLRHTLGIAVDPVESVGWDGDALEAQAFAHLAVRSLRGLPISLPSTTGVARPMTGGVHHRALTAA